MKIILILNEDDFVIIKREAMSSRLPAIAFISIFLFSCPAARAAEDYTLTIQNHRFVPEVLEIPANEKVKITIINKDPTPEEFESYELKREKIIRGNSRGSVFIGPLDPGSYPFFGEFNQETAQGRVVAK